MSADFEESARALREAIWHFSEAHGATILKETAATSALFLTWLDYLRTSVSKQHAHPILDGVQASLVEVAACISLGLARPAIFSMRTELDLLLAWIYFTDHPVEWHHLQATGEGYLLHGQILKFMKNHNNKFTMRFKLLEKTKNRSIDDPYKLLSTHIHSASIYAMPIVGSPDSIVKDIDDAKEIVELQFAVVEYLTDVLCSWYADRWADLPSPISKELESRLTPAQQKSFFG